MDRLVLERAARARELSRVARFLQHEQEMVRLLDRLGKCLDQQSIGRINKYEPSPISSVVSISKSHKGRCDLVVENFSEATITQANLLMHKTGSIG